MFGCFFNHSFGKVQSDGLQYCNRCGEARKPITPHPCTDGHIWKDTGEGEYVVTHFSYYEERKTYYVPQKCVNCGERRSVRKY